MERSKTYQLIRFSPEVILEAYLIFKRIVGKRGRTSSSGSLSVSYENETWDYDIEDEFFAEYRKGRGSANFIKSSSEHHLYIYVYTDKTIVAVRATSHQQIESIFQPFESNCKNSEFRIDKLSNSPNSYSSFEINNQLPSLLISKKLIVELEEYIINQTPKIVSIASEDIAKSFKISIRDEIGIHAVKNTDELRFSHLPNHTQELKITLHTYGSISIDLTMRFSKTKDDTEFSATVTAVDPRSVIIAINDGINQILQHHHTRNWLYHPPFAFNLAMSILGTVFFMALLDSHDYNLKIVSLLSVTFLAFFGIVARGLKPYSEFDSSIYQSKRKFLDWFVYGSLGFLFFGTIFPYLRKIFLGF
jgi:hypothetical protein